MYVSVPHALRRVLFVLGVAALGVVARSAEHAAAAPSAPVAVAEVVSTTGGAQPPTRPGALLDSRTDGPSDDRPSTRHGTRPDAQPNARPGTMRTGDAESERRTLATAPASTANGSGHQAVDAALDARLEALAQAAEASTAPWPAGPGPADTGAVRTGRYDFGAGAETVEFVEHGGMAFYQGDIVLGPADAVGAVDGALASGEAAQVTDSLILRQNEWPGGRIVYEIDERAFPPGSEDRWEIDAAVYAWNQQTLVWLVPRTWGNRSEHFVRFVADDPGCFAALGNFAAWESPQTINLAPGCDLAAATHEVGHTVGLSHEQARSDRDSYLNVNWWNIPTDPHMRAQYAKHTDGSDDRSTDWGPYDYLSVMHYQSLGIGVNPSLPVFNRRSCDPLDTSSGCVIDRNARLTTYDKAGVTRILTGEPAAPYTLEGDDDRSCLAVERGSREDGAAIVSAACRGDDTQRWYSYDVGASDGVVVINVRSRLCVTRDGGALVQRPCVGIGSQRFTFRTAAAREPELTALDPWTVYFGRTTETGAASRVTFVNLRAETLFLYWVDEYGRYRHYATLPAGAQHAQNTFAGQLWAVVNGRREIVTGFVATDVPARAVVR